MRQRKSFLSGIISISLIPVVVTVILIDKPDYYFFNFIHKIIVPVAEIMGQGISYPVRLVGKMSKNISKNRENLR